jgi:UDP-N-acetylmuramoyl-tripeptide--D-alanyl-D-alanine ligase
MQTTPLGTVETVTDGRRLSGRADLPLTGISTDTRTLRPGELFFALRGDTHDAHDFLDRAARRRAGAAVIHRRDAVQHAHGLPLVLVDDTTRALGDLARWHRDQCPTTVIGITGSNGKTTVKEMLFHILDGVVRSVKSIRSFNNAVGVPLTLFQIRPADVYAVVEMGTNSPGEIERLCEIANPDLGLITNVASTHLEGLGSVRGVAREKAALIQHTVRRGGALYNADDYWCRRIARAARGPTTSFGIGNDATIRGFHVRCDEAGVSVKVLGGPRVRLPVAGEHNAMNALAAIAVARKLGVDWGTVTERLATFALPPHRMELRTLNGVTLIDDAYNANPVSMEAAARTLSRLQCRGRRIFVAGDMLELGPASAALHRRVGATVAGFGVDYLLGVGAGAGDLLGAAMEHGRKEHELHLARSNADLARALLDLVEPGDAVLFKGSRGMHLEEVVGAVEEGLGASERPEPAVPVYEKYRSVEVHSGVPDGRRGRRVRRIGGV